MANIEIFGEIDPYAGWSIEKLKSEINAKGVNQDSITIQIHSPGGAVTEGFGMYDLLQGYQGEVITEGIGFVASIASIILLSGDKVRMAENAYLMIHNPYTMTGGDANQLRQTADLLDKMELQIADVYAKSMMKRKGKSYKDALSDALNYMAAETWFTAQEAKDAGLIDEVIQASQYQMDSFTALARFDSVPKALFHNYEINAKMKNKNFMERFLALFEDEQETQTVVQAESTPDADPIADARQLLEDAGFAIFSADELEAQETELQDVLNQAADKIKAMQTELSEARAQLKASAGAPSGGSVKAAVPTKRTATSDKQKAFDVLAKMLVSDIRN